MICPLLQRYEYAKYAKTAAPDSSVARGPPEDRYLAPRGHATTLS